MPEEIDAGAIRKFYAGNDVARAFLDHCAQRRRNRSHTTVEAALSSLKAEGGEFDRSDVVGLFKGLEQLNCGKFTAGRWNNPSRLVWHTDMIGVGKVAAGEDLPLTAQDDVAEDEEAEDEAAESEAAAAAEGAYLTHRFYLRPEALIEVDLPSDLQADEAKRLADFILALPFDPEA